MRWRRRCKRNGCRDVRYGEDLAVLHETQCVLTRFWGVEHERLVRVQVRPEDGVGRQSAFLSVNSHERVVVVRSERVVSVQLQTVRLS